MSSFYGANPIIGSSILDLGKESSRQSTMDFNSLTDASSFMMPNVADPAFFCRSNFASASGDKDKDQVVKFAKGTTTLAFKFNEGIIVSVDSRSTMGAYIASQTVKKVIGEFSVGDPGHSRSAASLSLVFVPGNNATKPSP